MIMRSRDIRWSHEQHICPIIQRFDELTLNELESQMRPFSFWKYALFETLRVELFGKKLVVILSIQTIQFCNVWWIHNSIISNKENFFKLELFKLKDCCYASLVNLFCEFIIMDYYEMTGIKAAI